MKTIREYISFIIEKLSPAYESQRERRQIAWWMLEAIVGIPRAMILAYRTELTPEQDKTLRRWISEQVIDHKPLQYILGTVPFLDLSIKVEPPVAIPRPETEYWVAELIDMFKPTSDTQISILDLCTGTGCIALALAQGLPKSQVTGVDINENAVALAQQNKKENAIANAQFVYSDLFTNLYDIKYDLIVSNPPYISSGQWKDIDPKIKNWEDERAMRANEDGLEIIRIIIDQAPNFLKIPTLLQDHELPQIVIEIGSNQGPRVKELLLERGYEDISIMQDQYGNDRVALARRNRK